MLVLSKSLVNTDTRKVMPCRLGAALLLDRHRHCCKPLHPLTTGPLLQAAHFISRTPAPTRLQSDSVPQSPPPPVSAALNLHIWPPSICALGIPLAHSGTLLLSHPLLPLPSCPLSSQAMKIIIKSAFERKQKPSLSLSLSAVDQSTPVSSSILFRANFLHLLPSQF